MTCFRHLVSSISILIKTLHLTHKFIATIIDIENIIKNWSKKLKQTRLHQVTKNNMPYCDYYKMKKCNHKLLIKIYIKKIQRLLCIFIAPSLFLYYVSVKYTSNINNIFWAFRFHPINLKKKELSRKTCHAIININ